MTWYSSLREAHVACVILTACGFALRALWMIRGSALLDHPLTRSLPHVVDALLLASALGLAFLLGQFPFSDDWLTAKFFGLVTYILSATVALRRGRTKRFRLMALAAAWAAFAYIVAVAVTRNPWPLGGYPGIS